VKRLILYAILIILFILALMSSRAVKAPVSVQAPEHKEEVQETTTGFSFFSTEGAAPEKSPVPAITIIKVPIKKDFSLDQEERKPAKKKIPEPEVSEYSPGFDAGGEESGDISEEGEGITIIEKYPSEAEQKEMNERGIIIY